MGILPVQFSGLGWMMESFTRDSATGIDGEYVPSPGSSPIRYRNPDSYRWILPYSPGPGKPAPLFEQAAFDYGVASVSGGFFHVDSPTYSELGGYGLIPFLFVGPESGTSLELIIRSSGIYLRYADRAYWANESGGTLNVSAANLPLNKGHLGRISSRFSFPYYGIFFGYLLPFRQAHPDATTEEENAYLSTIIPDSDFKQEIFYHTCEIDAFKYTSTDQLSVDVSALNEVGEHMGHPGFGYEVYSGTSPGDVLVRTVSKVLFRGGGRDLEIDAEMVAVNLYNVGPGIEPFPYQMCSYEDEVQNPILGSNLDPNDCILGLRITDDYIGPYNKISTQPLQLDLRDLYPIYSVAPPSSPLISSLTFDVIAAAGTTLGNKIDYWNSGSVSRGGGFRRGKMGLG